MKFDELLERLQEFDLLLDADSKLPSDNVRGSWWTHPQSHEMYNLACQLRSHPDVLMLKLISGQGHSGSSAFVTGGVYGRHDAACAANGTDRVGQFGYLRRIGNPPGVNTELLTGRLPIGRRLPTCPHKISM